MNAEDEAEFVHQVREALAHLYDYAYLQRHPLAARLVPPEAAATRTRGQELRRILLDAIEALNPGHSVPIRAPERRPHAILFGLYVEGRGQPEVASSLGVGSRQLRRDRAAALAALAGLLHDRYAQASGGAQLAQEPLRQESERLAQGREPVDLHELVQGLLPLLESMAAERGVKLLSHVRSGLPQPSGNRTLLRQALIGLASQALSSLPLRRVCFEARPSSTEIGVGLRLEQRAGSASARPVLQLEPARTLATALGGSLLEEALADETLQVWVVLPLQEELIVLVVDDNQELFALFQRYAAGQPYRMVHAGSADQALALARTLGPQVITIDLMMPGRDGWELLQALRVEAATARTPVIICSVLEQPELALSLGAQACLKKPVGQADLLRALEAARMRAWSGEGHPGSPAGSRASP